MVSLNEVLLRVFVFYDGATDKLLLVVHALSGLKAQCQLHPHCICWLNGKAAAMPGAAPLADLLRWVHAGRHQSEGQHYKAGQELKRSYGMKVVVPA